MAWEFASCPSRYASNPRRQPGHGASIVTTNCSVEASLLLQRHVAHGALRGLAIAGALFLSRGAEAIAYTANIQAPLAIALISTLAFAVALKTWLIAIPTARAAGSAVIVAELTYLAVGSLGGLVVLLAFRTLMGPSQILYCMPDIPWRVSIVGFGGFALGLLDAMINRHGLASLLGPAAYLGLFWIAPWYGFFQPAAFLAQAIAYPCEHRSPPAVATAFAVMCLGQIIGARLASWLTRR